jgi:hypothetical protein
MPLLIPLLFLLQIEQHTALFVFNECLILKRIVVKPMINGGADSIQQACQLPAIESFAIRQGRIRRPMANHLG